ncbi:ribonucleoside triphosphate reductase [Thermoanaerobacter sp. A7A]|uniref:ribonucleoside triphosphate reductase n=1 Tax=Thermoanaerobacter sp. A7A TaxID=1350366 RepID=UPI00041AD8EF|nr:ribonucleoside triphosphate reductase [Thermoanaerobacter sp. A7A]
MTRNVKIDLQKIPQVQTCSFQPKLSKIEKRDGRFEDFDFQKISNAIWKAIESNPDAIEGIDPQKALQVITAFVQINLNDIESETIHIEKIQDIVIESIKQANFPVLAYVYKNYRKSKEKERNIFKERTIKLIDGYINKNTWKVRENSNTSFSMQGLNHYVYSELSKTYWFERVYNKKAKQYHENGDIHVHDLCSLSTYCCGWDLKQLLTEGFGGCPNKTECEPPAHFDSAIGQVYNFLYTLSGEAAGAMAFSNVDVLLAPYIRKDKLSRSEVKQSIQNMIYNLNNPTRVGFQCLSEDTEILTPTGWKSFNDISVGSTIYTFNTKTKIFEQLGVKAMFVKEYSGLMYHFVSEHCDQFVTPEHRVVVKNANNEYEFKKADYLFQKQEDFEIPFTYLDNNDPNKINEVVDSESISELGLVLDYDGIVWCPTTDNGTVIARRNGKIFITGNSPFTNFTLDLECPEHMKNEEVYIAGKPTGTTYGEYQEEIDLFNETFCEVMMEGDKKKKIFTFPIPTYCIDENFDWDNPNLKNLWMMTAKYGIPYFANYINSDMSKEDARSMCCRLRLDLSELNKRGGGLFGASSLTGSIGVVTINLPRLGHLAKDKDDFKELLLDRLECAKQTLIEKTNFVEKMTEYGLYPYTKHYLRHIKERFGSYWTNHFKTIGIIGMHEACINLFQNPKGIESEEGYEFAQEILDFINRKLIEYQKESGLLFNLEATPAEGTSFRLANKDKELYPNQYCFKVENKSFYTNSTFLPVNSKKTLFEALAHQEKLQSKYTGGTVFHGFLGESIDNHNVVKNVLRKVLTNYNIPYFSFTPTFSICSEHGYIKGSVAKCPTCNRKTLQYSRVVGYYTPVDTWNDGKQEEFKIRTVYDDSIK